MASIRRFALGPGMRFITSSRLPTPKQAYLSSGSEAIVFAASCNSEIVRQLVGLRVRSPELTRRAFTKIIHFWIFARTRIDWTLG